MNRMKIPGIPDELFERGDVPVTKEEIRTVVLSKLCLEDDSRIIDIGAGTGSVTVECALRAHKGTVYAIERDEEALVLIKKNIQKFNISNVVIISGEASAVLKNAESFNRAFIGGSGGKLREILDFVYENIESEGIIVVTAITLDTLFGAQEFFKMKKLQHEIIQLAVTKINEVAGLSMLQAQNPVFIITAYRGII